MRGIRSLGPVSLVVLLLTGCASGADDPVTGALQQGVVAVAEAASRDDIAAAEQELLALETLLAEAVAGGTVDETRRAGIQSAIDRVRLDLVALRTAQTPAPITTPSPARPSDPRPAPAPPTAAPSASPSASPSPSATPSASPSGTATPPVPTPSATVGPAPSASPSPSPDDDGDGDGSDGGGDDDGNDDGDDAGAGADDGTGADPVAGGTPGPGAADGVVAPGGTPGGQDPAPPRPEPAH